MKCVMRVTEYCNLKCSYCYMNSINNNYNFESLTTILEVINSLNEINTDKLIITGGEPFLRPDIFDIIKESKKYFETTILTNGSLINNKIAKNLSKIGIDGVSISFESTNANIHNEYRDNSYNSAVNAAKLIKDQNIPVDMSICVSKNNVHDFINLIKLAEDLKLDSITFEALNPSGRGINLKNLMLNSLETEKFLDNVYKYMKNQKPSIKIFMFYPQWILWDDKASGCEVGKSLFAVKYNGDILPCSNLPIKLGNILKDDFNKIWNSDLLKNLRCKRIGICNDCSHKYKCGGCRSQALKDGNMFSSDPTCNYLNKI